MIFFIRRSRRKICLDVTGNGWGRGQDNCKKKIFWGILDIFSNVLYKKSKNVSNIFYFFSISPKTNFSLYL